MRVYKEEQYQFFIFKALPLRI